MVLAPSVITSKAAYDISGGILRYGLEGLGSFQGLLVAFNLKEVDPGHLCIVVNKQYKVLGRSSE